MAIGGDNVLGVKYLAKKSKSLNFELCKKKVRDGRQKEKRE